MGFNSAFKGLNSEILTVIDDNQCKYPDYRQTITQSRAKPHPVKMT